MSSGALANVQVRTQIMCWCPKDANLEGNKIRKYFTCTKGWRAISRGISCIIFIHLTGVLWCWAHAARCIRADCCLPLKVKARGYLTPNLWSRVTSAVSYRFNVPWHSNGSVPAPIKEHFVAEAEDYTSDLAAMREWHRSQVWSPRPRGPRCLSARYPNKQVVRHWAETLNC